MAISATELKKLALRSGGRCAFGECRKPLTMADPQTGEVTVLGHVAHIVAQQHDGPRGDPNMNPAQRDKYENLILLCTSHHQLVDAPANFATWTVDRLTALREDHERWVESRLHLPEPSAARPADRTDTIYSTLLPVERMVRYVYSASTALRVDRDAPDVQSGQYPLMVPFALHEARLWAFQNLRDADGPFRSCVDRGSTERLDLSELASNPEGQRLVQQLLNRTLNKLTGRRDLRLDTDHHRYYFTPEENGKARSELYLTLTGRSSSLSVVWQPVRKSTGEARDFWLHRAVSLGFVQIDTGRWCLAMRPEFHVTEDGLEPLASEQIGARVTRKKSRMFNADLLKEVQFWRHYLSDGLARIVMKFSESQAIHVSSTLINGDVIWPGIPAEYDINYSNVEFLDDLFTIAEIIDFTDAETDDWEDENEPGDDHE